MDEWQVALLVAVVGLTGVLLTAVVTLSGVLLTLRHTGRQEAKRRDHEDAVRREEREHQDKHRWASERRAAYVAMEEALSDYYVGDSAKRSAISAERFGHVLAEALLVAPQEVYAEAYRAWEAALALSRASEGTPQLRALEKRYTRYHSRFLNAARADIGAAGPVWRPDPDREPEEAEEDTVPRCSGSA